MNITYKQGWNLMSSPVEVEVNNIPNIVPNTLHEYSNKVYTSPNDNKIIPGKGYWLKFNQDTTVNVPNNTPDEGGVDLIGYKLIRIVTEDQMSATPYGFFYNRRTYLNPDHLPPQQAPRVFAPVYFYEIYFVTKSYHGLSKYLRGVISVPGSTSPQNISHTILLHNGSNFDPEFTVSQMIVEGGEWEPLVQVVSLLTQHNTICCTCDELGPINQTFTHYHDYKTSVKKSEDFLSAIKEFTSKRRSNDWNISGVSRNLISLGYSLGGWSSLALQKYADTTGLKNFDLVLNIPMAGCYNMEKMWDRITEVDETNTPEALAAAAAAAPVLGAGPHPKPFPVQYIIFIILTILHTTGDLNIYTYIRSDLTVEVDFPEPGVDVANWPLFQSGTAQEFIFGPVAAGPGAQPGDGIFVNMIEMDNWTNSHYYAWEWTCNLGAWAADTTEDPTSFLTYCSMSGVHNAKFWLNLEAVRPFSVNHFLTENSLYSGWTPKSNIKLIHSNADEIVPHANSQEFYDLHHTSNFVTLDTLVGMDHADSTTPALMGIFDDDSSKFVGPNAVQFIFDELDAYAVATGSATPATSAVSDSDSKYKLDGKYEFVPGTMKNGFLDIKLKKI